MTREEATQIIENMPISHECREFFGLALEALRQPEIIRCKDCKHRPIKPNDYENGFDLEFPDGKCPCKCADGWYSWYPADNWFCADGERKEVK